jgi:hypothetical protein
MILLLGPKIPIEDVKSHPLVCILSCDSASDILHNPSRQP